MHIETDTKGDHDVPSFSTMILIDMDLSTKTFYAARFRSSPFSVIGFEYCQLGSHDFSSGEDLDSIGWVLQHVSRWKEKDHDAPILFPVNLTHLPWTQLFLCYARRLSNDKEIVSMCGPFSSNYYLRPISPDVKLFKLGSECSIKKKLQSVPMDRSAESAVPFKDMWDWRSALIISHLYCWGMIDVVREISGRELIAL